MQGSSNYKLAAGTLSLPLHSISKGESKARLLLGETESDFEGKSGKVTFQGT